jgi:uridine phosphorylase
MRRVNPLAKEVPLLRHRIDEETAFTPQALIAAVQSIRQLPHTRVPPVCVLEFDGDLTDRLVAERLVTPVSSWACFHTPMFAMTAGDDTCGIVPRTIGGPYAVLVAEQLAASGARLIVGLTSAGRVHPDLTIPSLVVVSGAIRDEGTSYHYVQPGRAIGAPASVLPYLHEELGRLETRVVEGLVWTTDAPYRETRRQIEHYAQCGVLAVEMQAASLFAFSAARSTPVAVVAHVSNAIDHTGRPFDRGPSVEARRILEAICKGGVRFVSTAA